MAASKQQQISGVGYQDVTIDDYPQSYDKQATAGCDPESMYSVHLCLWSSKSIKCFLQPVTVISMGLESGLKTIRLNVLALRGQKVD
jgi:hypothetical protein